MVRKKQHAEKEVFEIPKYDGCGISKSENQREWICTHLLWYFTGKYNTKETLIECFKEKYGVTPAYMKHRNEESRN